MTISDERGAEMAGFDPKWRDPADYIIGITKQGQVKKLITFTPFRCDILL